MKVVCKLFGLRNQINFLILDPSCCPNPLFEREGESNRVMK
jgi:hypothetical protein